MTRLWHRRPLHRRIVRLHNHLGLILLVLATGAGAVVVIDRIASLSAHAARALL